MSANLALVSVPFQGGAIDAVRDDRGVWVSVRRVCDVLGIAHQGQFVKLQASEWATITTIVTVGSDGKQREMSFINQDAFPMWLATIDVNRVAEQARPILIAYQREAARVLREHFFPRPTDAAPPTVADRILGEVREACAQGETKLAVALTKALAVAVGPRSLAAPDRTKAQDGFLERVQSHLATLDQAKGFTTVEILTGLGVATNGHNQARVAKVLRHLGWQKGRQQRRDGVRVRPFFAPGAAHPSLIEPLSDLAPSACPPDLPARGRPLP